MNLLDVLTTINFRKINPEETMGMFRNDTILVRIYIDSEDFPPLFFFEFGIDDWHDDKDNHIPKIINENILHMDVKSISIIEEFSTIQITIT